MKQPFPETLKKGDRGTAVALVQFFFRTRFPEVEVNGIFDEKFEQFIKEKVQKEKGLPETGILDITFFRECGKGDLSEDFLSLDLEVFQNPRLHELAVG